MRPFAPTLPRPPHPRLARRDDRDTPLFIEAGWRDGNTYFGKTEEIYFSRRDWTVESALNRLTKFDFSRTRICEPEGRASDAAVPDFA
jgi:hypothetical protein